MKCSTTLRKNFQQHNVICWTKITVNMVDTTSVSNKPDYPQFFPVYFHSSYAPVPRKKVARWWSKRWEIERFFINMFWYQILELKDFRFFVRPFFTKSLFFRVLKVRKLEETWKFKIRIIVTQYCQYWLFYSLLKCNSELKGKKRRGRTSFWKNGWLQKWNFWIQFKEISLWPQFYKVTVF